MIIVQDVLCEVSSNCVHNREGKQFLAEKFFVVSQ